MGLLENIPVLEPSDAFVPDPSRTGITVLGDLPHGKFQGCPCKGRTRSPVQASQGICAKSPCIPLGLCDITQAAAIAEKPEIVHLYESE